MKLLTKIAATAAAALYALSPIDLIPDVIPVLGQLDDITVIVLLVLYWMATRDAAPAMKNRPAAEQVIDIDPVD